MKKFLLPALIATSSLLIHGCNSEPSVAKASTQRDFKASDYRKVAVQISIPRDIQQRFGNSDGLSSAIENTIQSALLEKGYEVAERSEVGRVLKEINFQGESGMTNEQQAKFGEAIGCRGMFVVTLNKLSKDTTYSGNIQQTKVAVNISTKLLDLKKCTSVWTSGFAYPTRSALGGLVKLGGNDDEMAAIDECTQAIARAIPAIK